MKFVSLRNKTKIAKQKTTDKILVCLTSFLYLYKVTKKLNKKQKKKTILQFFSQCTINDFWFIPRAVNHVDYYNLCPLLCSPMGTIQISSIMLTISYL